MADDSSLEEDVQGYLDESDIELNDDEMTLLMWQCHGVQRRPGGNSSSFVRMVLAISVDASFRAEHAEGLYALVSRDRGEVNEQEEHKSPSTISSKTSNSRTEVIPLDLSGRNFADMPHPPFNDAGSSIVIVNESDSLATADTADPTKSAGGKAVL